MHPPPFAQDVECQVTSTKCQECRAELRRAGHRLPLLGTCRLALVTLSPKRGGPGLTREPGAAEGGRPEGETRRKVSGCRGLRTMRGGATDGGWREPAFGCGTSPHAAGRWHRDKQRAYPPRHGIAKPSTRCIVWIYDVHPRTRCFVVSSFRTCCVPSATQLTHRASGWRAAGLVPGTGAMVALDAHPSCKRAWVVLSAQLPW